MDEKVALEAAHKTIAQIKANSGAATALSEEDLVRVLRNAYEHFVKHVPRNRPATTSSGAWQLPEGLDFGVWTKFQRDAAEVELIALALSKILGFTDEAVADGLGVSLGTARYRIGKGVRTLGQVARQAEMKKV